MIATNKKRLTKKAFEQILLAKYDKVEANVTYENNHDGTSPTRLTLYYEVLPEPDEHGIPTRHCGTWIGGECWEFMKPATTNA